jgi:hypothetical protein
VFAAGGFVAAAARIKVTPPGLTGRNERIGVPMKRVLMLLLFLPACAATDGDMQGARDTWRGASYDDVVARWGAPNRYTTLSDGGYVYTWESEATAPGGRVYPSIGIFGGSRGIGVGTGVTVGPGGGGELVRCARTLIFRNARVAEQTWQGDPAFCETFRR